MSTKGGVSALFDSVLNCEPDKIRVSMLFHAATVYTGSFSNS